MKSTPLFVLLIVLLSACSPRQNTDFIIEDYQKHSEAVEEVIEILKVKIAENIKSNPSRNKKYVEIMDSVHIKFNTIYSHVDKLLQNKKNTKSDFMAIYDSSLLLIENIEITLNDYPTGWHRSEYKTEIFEAILNKEVWENYLSIYGKKGINILLSKLKCDLKIGERNVLKFCQSSMANSKIICCGASAKVIAYSSYIPSGFYFDASIYFLDFHGYNKIKRIVVNNEEIPIEGGYGRYIVKAPDYVGFHPVKGFIEVDGEDGIEKHEFITEWQSFVPAVSFEFDKFQKIKSGEETNFIVNIPGFRQDDIIVETTKGKITKQKGIGKYKILVDEKPNTQFLIKVSVKMPDGSIRKMGERKMVVE